MADLEIRLRGAKYPVSVRGDGTFEVWVNGKNVRDTTFEGVKAKAAREAAKMAVKVSVPFCQVHWRGVGAERRPEIVSGVATGLHAVNHNILVRWDGTEGKPGKSDQMERFSASGRTYQPMDAAERGELVHLLLVQREADDAVRTFLSTRELRLAEAVQRAIDEVAAATAKEGKEDGSAAAE